MSATPRVLIIDDEGQVRRLLRWAMEGQGWKVHEAETGGQGLTEAAMLRPDVLLLDLGLPDMDGVEVLKRLREWTTLPVVVLSVRDSAEDKIAALDAGADDYLQKPFDTRELLARVRAVQRRSQGGEDSPVITAGDLEVDVAAHEARCGGAAFALTPTEFALLRVLARHSGKIVTHRQLLREVWGPKSEEHSQYLRVYFTHLRRKLAGAGVSRAEVVNEPGIGYRLRERSC